MPVQFAFCHATQKSVDVNSLRKGTVRKGTFRCLDEECAEPVFARLGHKRTWHFAHYCEHASKRCKREASGGGESEVHLKAKHLIATNVGSIAFIKDKCNMCKRQRPYAGTWECEAKVEERIATVPGTVRVIDVMLCTKGGRPRFAVEVFHTHAVDDDKRYELDKLGLPVIEVDAKHVVSTFSDAVGKTARGLTHLLMCSETCSRMCEECELASAYRNEVNQWLEYERNHDSMWFYYGHQMWQKLRAKVKSQMHRRHQVQGFCIAKQRLEESPVATREPYVAGVSRRCIHCSKWVQAYSKAFFSDIMPYSKFVTNHWKQGSKEFQYDNYSVIICNGCCMPCTSCENPMLVEDASRYGCCWACNSIVKLMVQEGYETKKDVI